jgi:hypothetical protein
LLDGSRLERQKQIADSDLILFDVLHLKFLVQRGSWISARRQIDAIESNGGFVQMLSMHSQYGAYRRRVMLVRTYESRSPPSDWNPEGDDITIGYE